MYDAARPGTVYLVGAGPGDPELITMRGLALLGLADVVVYDRLVNPALLQHVRPAARLIDAGASRHGSVPPARYLHRLLVREAQRPAVVVRLKEGDPFVFGRGDEEALALAQAGVPFEVVSGVTCAISTPAEAGIPVTHRNVARSFTVVTDPGAGSGQELEWAQLARSETLVVMTGLDRLADVAARLQQHGRPPDTPAAVIRPGRQTRSQVVLGTLHDIAARTGPADSPATMVIGEVVRMATRLARIAPSADPGPASVHGSKPAA